MMGEKPYGLVHNLLSRHEKIPGNSGCSDLTFTEESSPRAAYKSSRHCEDEVYCSNTCLVATGKQTCTETSSSASDCIGEYPYQ